LVRLGVGVRVLNTGETVVQTAAREVAEEVGLVLQPHQLQFTGVTHHRPPHGDSRVRFGFVAELDDQAEPRNVEPAKCIQLAWFAADRLPGPACRTEPKSLACT
jgi:8-oxo-dGTP diphosphatase